MTRLARRRRFISSLDLVHAIIAAVNNYYAIPHNRTFSSTRGSPIVAHARMIAMFLTHGATALSTNEIGRIFGRHHSTVLYAIATVEDALKYDGDLRGAVIEIAHRVATGNPLRRPLSIEGVTRSALAAAQPKLLCDNTA